MLPTRGPQAYGSFTHALSQDGYTHISQHLEEALGQLKKDQGAVTKCTPTKNDKEIGKLKLPPEGAIPPVNRDENNRKKKKRLKREKVADTSTKYFGDVSCSSDEEHEDVNGHSLTTTSHCSQCSRYLPSNIEDPEFRNLLREHCCMMMENIEPRDITDYPYQVSFLS